MKIKNLNGTEYESTGKFTNQKTVHSAVRQDFNQSIEIKLANFSASVVFETGKSGKKVKKELNLSETNVLSLLKENKANIENGMVVNGIILVEQTHKGLNFFQ